MLVNLNQYQAGVEDDAPAFAAQCEKSYEKTVFWPLWTQQLFFCRLYKSFSAGGPLALYIAVVQCFNKLQNHLCKPPAGNCNRNRGPQLLLTTCCQAQLRSIDGSGPSIQLGSKSIGVSESV